MKKRRPGIGKSAYIGMPRFRSILASAGSLKSASISSFVLWRTRSCSPELNMTTSGRGAASGRAERAASCSDDETRDAATATATATRRDATRRDEANDVAARGGGRRGAVGMHAAGRVSGGRQDSDRPDAAHPLTVLATAKRIALMSLREDRYSRHGARHRWRRRFVRSFIRSFFAPATSVRATTATRSAPRRI